MASSKAIQKIHQNKWADKQFYLPDIVNQLETWGISSHSEVDNVMSSQAACLNVFSGLQDENLLRQFLGLAGLKIDQILPFPSGTSFDGIQYPDTGPVVFEWIGPRISPINEGQAGGRGKLRTSIDAFCFAEIDGKVTQILIEWKFTESYGSSLDTLSKFIGGQGVERLFRYSSVLRDLRLKKKKVVEFPFTFIEPNAKWGLGDLGYEPLYQLLRMHLLAITTLGMKFGDYQIDDYRIIHLSHSANDPLNILQPDHLEFAPGLRQSGLSGSSLHNSWSNLLTPTHRERFVGAYWDEILNEFAANYPENGDQAWLTYCLERYCE